MSSKHAKKKNINKNDDNSNVHNEDSNAKRGNSFITKTKPLKNSLLKDVIKEDKGIYIYIYTHMKIFLWYCNYIMYMWIRTLHFPDKNNGGGDHTKNNILNKHNKNSNAHWNKSKHAKEIKLIERWNKWKKTKVYPKELWCDWSNMNDIRNAPHLPLSPRSCPRWSTTATGRRKWEGEQGRTKEQHSWDKAKEGSGTIEKMEQRRKARK